MQKFIGETEEYIIIGILTNNLDTILIHLIKKGYTYSQFLRDVITIQNRNIAKFYPIDFLIINRIFNTTKHG